MMLLDTHTIIWYLAIPEKLSKRAHTALFEAHRTGEKLGYSPVSLYEIAYAVRRGRLPLNSPAMEFIAAVRKKLELVPLTAEIAVCAAELPAPFHGDPMDRLIAATAIVEDCVLITHDERIRDVSVCKVLW